ncbi:putative LytR family transcriptional regulator [Streptomyces sp. NBRC 110611]|uniref:LCP family protein n=1 Tax=Streptomyces sp. NBRC 110611 TaxID=1621259 RepID=UPI0008308301|nr:LCP family protein [Streptomyces sp. NBRC 110611]GAU71061.1 putative LytR family transcriptional regulator [Streptomyces sp. NBRC 110611]
MNHPRRNQHRKQAPRRLGRKLLLCALALVLCAGAGGWYLYRDLAGQIGSSYALDDGSPRSAGGDTNILLMGLDSRKDQNGEDLPADVLDKLHAGSSDIGGYNTNTLILLHVPGDGSRATAFSIPRDDFVDIPGHGQDKIKKAYGLAKARTEDRLYQQGVRDRHQLEHDGREAGRRAEIETVRSFLGVPIDHFAEVNLVGFLHIADALGGVEVCLKKPAKDRYSGADFTAGRQTLNGPQSLAFVRQRHGLPAGDLDRTRRQQAFLASATHKLNSAGTFTDPGRLLNLLDVAKKDLVIDEGWDLLSFIKQARNLSGGNVEFSTLPIEGFGRHNGEDINRVDPGKIRRLVAERIGKGHGSGTTPGRSGGDAPGHRSGEAPAPSANDTNTPASGPSSPRTAAPSAPTPDDGAIPCVD